MAQIAHVLRARPSKALYRWLERAPVAICVSSEQQVVLQANATCRRLMTGNRTLGATLSETLSESIAQMARETLRTHRVGSLCWSPGVTHAAWHWVSWCLPTRPAQIVSVGFEVTKDACELRAVAQLEQRILQKDAVIAQLVHELRGPLAPMAAALAVLRTQPPSQPAPALCVIERQLKHMAWLLSDTSEAIRSDCQSTRGVHRELVDILQLVEQAVELACPMIDAARQVLTCDVPRGLYVHGDPGKLLQVLANLLTNAAKYTRPGGAIRVAARMANGEVVLSVSDSGIGIAPEVLPHVFEIFVRSPQARAEPCDGFGVGLHVVRSLVTAHGGSVEARSDGPGRGSEFIVRLPCRPTIGAAQPQIV